MKTIDDVKQFWDTSPLFSDEYQGTVGSPEFFEYHEKVIVDDIMGSHFDNNFSKYFLKGSSILDVGCGPGFWVRQFCRMGLQVSACDISTTAVNLTKKSLKIFGLNADVKEGNAENLSYDDESFDLINCQGVIHHTPNTEKCISEFYRVLKPGGLVCFSVYYRNFILRHKSMIKIIANLFGKLIVLRGRGRQDLLKQIDAHEIVRLYDGKDNPIGKSYTFDEMRALIKSNNLILVKKWHSYFPVRALPIKIPKSLHRFLNHYFGFLIVFLARKPEK